MSIQTIFLLGIILLITSCHRTHSITAASSSATKEMKLVWSDEFEVDGLPDHTKWGYDIGDGCPQVCGWGNNELQYYTHADHRNSRVENGNLIIEAHKSPMHGKEYTSARLVTRAQGDWKYGKISIRAKLPTGLGTWPAIWMLPSHNQYGGWPKSGEIDIMEHVGYEKDTIYGTVHTSSFNHMLGTQVDKAIYQPEAESTFKTYSIEWNEEQIKWTIDDKHYHTFANKKMSEKEWPFDKKFYLILNIAIGGNWGGKLGVDTKIWPQKMEVDWVRVFQEV